MTPGQITTLTYAGLMGHEFVVLRPATRGEDTWDMAAQVTTEGQAWKYAAEDEGAVVFQQLPLAWKEPRCWRQLVRRDKG